MVDMIESEVPEEDGQTVIVWQDEVCTGKRIQPPDDASQESGGEDSPEQGPQKYSFELFYKSFMELSDDQRRSIYREFMAQGEMESRKHESYIQRQGILFAFSSLILIESILNIDAGHILTTREGMVYFAGLIAIVSSMTIEIWGILSSYTYPQIGMHLWDLEDRVIAGNLDTLEEDMIEQYLRSIDWYIYCNEKLHGALVASSIILLMGAALVLTSMMMGV